MAHLIDKDALITEIGKRISEYENCGIDNTSINAKIIALQRLLIYINTLEVKEVNLEKEIENWIENNQDTAGFYNNVEFAKHFFELGLSVSNKAQKGGKK